MVSTAFSPSATVTASGAMARVESSSWTTITASDTAVATSLVLSDGTVTVAEIVISRLSSGMLLSIADGTTKVACCAFVPSATVMATGSPVSDGTVMPLGIVSVRSTDSDEVTADCSAELAATSMVMVCPASAFSARPAEGISVPELSRAASSTTVLSRRTTSAVAAVESALTSAVGEVMEIWKFSSSSFGGSVSLLMGSTILPEVSPAAMVKVPVGGNAPVKSAAVTGFVPVAATAQSPV